MSLEVSVVVPTYNSVQKLPGILQALEDQTVADFEVVVVVDGSTDDTVEFLQSFHSDHFQLRVIEQENKGRSAVRNTGAKESSRDLLIFFDDDMHPESESIEKHILFHKNNPDAICGGNQLENIQDAKTDFDRYRCYLRERWLKPYNGQTKITWNNLYLTAANFSISKNRFFCLGGFDEELRDHEDRDLARRILELGYELYFDPGNIAWHNDFVSVRSYIERRREYQTELVRQGLSVARFFMKRLWYLVFAKIFGVSSIESSLLRFLPKGIRYRIYSFIIWGLAVYFPEHKL